MHSISSSSFSPRPWGFSTPFYFKGARYSVHLSDSYMGDNLKRSNFFRDETKNVGLTCSRLEKGSNIYYFWSFLMHSTSWSDFCPRPWCISTPFYSKRARYSVRLSDSSMEAILKRTNFFHRWDQKSGFNLSSLGNSFQHLLLLKFHHTLKIFIKFFFAALVQFYSVLFQESKIYCSSQWFNLGGDLKEKHFFPRMRPKNGFNLSTFRNRFQPFLLLKYHHALNIFIKLLFAALVHFHSVLL